MRRLLLLLPAFAVAATFLVRYRRWHLRWGATDAESACGLPGDDLLDAPAFVSTRAITIDAPPDAVWPWIVQIGYGRAGFYAYDLLDNLGRPSADHVIPELQDPQVGDWIPMSPTINDRTAFRVRDFRPNEWMLWAKPDSTWCWRLERIGATRTRLVSRIRAQHQFTSPSGLAGVALLELGDFPMNRRELLNIKQRAEATAA